ncbi:MAG: hypothetical protein JWO55_870 [Candidatus Saccharibacteria bacterium]|jgi:hypothetical protein|nr:hypothetical protein [Candidatus Saccharibacteria bacterium]
MDGYVAVGVALIFVAVALSGYYLWHSHRMSRAPEYQELRRAATIIRLRNAAIIIAMLSFSGFSLLLAGMSRLSLGSEAYIARSSLSTYALYLGLAMTATVIWLTIISRKVEFNFNRLLQMHAVKEKFRAGLKFSSRPKSKPKRKKRV